MTTTPQVPETWFSRDLPVLVSVVARIETEGHADRDGVLRDTGLDELAVERAVRALQEAGYFRTYFEGGGNFGVLEIYERARREAGAWPTADVMATRLLTALETIAENSANPDKRSAARRLLDAASGDGRAALSGALGNIISSAAG